MLSNMEQLSQIDEEVAALQATIRELYNKRNRFIPISRLPPELISRVFLCLRDVTVSNNPNAPIHHSHNHYSKELSWTVTMHVCRQWRDVALGFPELWNNIDLSLPFQWVDAFFERSKVTSLIVTIPASLRERQANTALRIFKQPYRLQSLKISAYSQSPGSKALELITSLSGVATPLLQSIVLNFELAYGHIGSTTPIIPKEFCSGGTPLLRHLELKYCRIPWASPLFDNLTTFSMNTGGFVSYDNAQGSFADLFDALQRMSKGIEELDLGIDLPEATSFNGHSPVAFPKLKKLKLKTRLQDCIAILKHLSLPISATLDLTVPGPPSTNAPAAKVTGSELAASIDAAWLATPSPFTSSSLDSNAKPSIHALEISPTQIAGGTKARLWIDSVDIAKRPMRLKKDKRRVLIPPPPAPLTLTISPGSFILIATLPIQNLQSIDLKTPISKWMWGELAKLPSIQSIALNSETGPSFLRYVYSDPALKSRRVQQPFTGNLAETTKKSQPKTEHYKRPKSKIRRPSRTYLFGKLILNKAIEAHIRAEELVARPPPTKPTYFSNLGHLSFTEVDFGLEQYSEPDEDTAIHWDKLLNFLLFRRDSPVPISSVRALTCINLMKLDVSSIKAVVPKVEWDGLEEQRDDYDLGEMWSDDHDSEECDGECYDHRESYRSRYSYGSSFDPFSLLAAGFDL